ncbi:hypothetical protein [Microbulbifer spongiae]|uniref:Uncharacterized protein n=1 Tax=Microbulbifer spongiae TaxID=2944933 RepID=A0ABY9EBF1_9GAMM|nr:hypothetical protein [Microbulbifer sp. MI-G]WKD49492.1 hypothetical protein M8T91_16595 [Microbulbifer sp. MI-G]
MQSIARQIEQLPYPLDKILLVAQDLLCAGVTGPPTNEQIAAAFVLARVELLPPGCDVVEAWEHLDIEWRLYVRHLWQDYRHLIEALEVGAAHQKD